MNKPLISVITVCFNAEQTIAETIKSVKRQDCPNFEYILVDGCSTDGTAELVQSLNKDGWIKFISEKDNGLYDAINKGISISQGEIICLLHADDTFADFGTLSHILFLFNNNPNADAVAASVNIYRGSEFNMPYRVYDSTTFRTWQFRIGMQPPHPGFFVKRSAFEQVGYYRTQYKISGDFDWLLRAIYLCKLKVLYTNYTAVHMRDGGMSSSGWKSKKLMNNENLRILKFHGIYSNGLLIYLKYIFKIFQVRRFF